MAWLEARGHEGVRAATYAEVVRAKEDAAFAERAGALIANPPPEFYRHRPGPPRDLAHEALEALVDGHRENQVTATPPWPTPVVSTSPRRDSRPAKGTAVGTVVRSSEYAPDQREHDSRDSRDTEGVPTSRRPARPTSFTAEELMRMTFAPPRWAVPGIVPEGVTMLAGPPKVGKSWLSMGLAVAVASGGKALGAIDITEAGDVLYLALEDTDRRLRDRLGKVLAGAPLPRGRLTFSIQCEPLDAGGDERIAEWLEAHPDRRLVVIDVLARVRGRTDPRGSAYDADYRVMSRAKRLADDYGVAVVVVHHTRKAAADDFLDLLSGTQGLAGGADGVMVLQRARGQADGTLHVVGRDVDEQELALSFSAEHGTWSLLEGPALEHLVSDTRAAILAHLREHPGQGPKAIAAATGLSYELVKRTAGRMADDGQLTRGKRGTYTVVPTVPTVPSPGQGRKELSRSLSPSLELSLPESVCERCGQPCAVLVMGRCRSCAYPAGDGLDEDEK
ncbi:AAA family ATPase [Actinomycetospora lutea]|uniref:AAA family ATPase n=1 Tax=Actinomycetospora lutea TaxID=663604 RepID=UPI002365C369|nr:AAA family ATPase [Actinomycetospora lutea]MDD7940454.1 AAA family ATPase [Actinomycetospora lutea]